MLVLQRRSWQSLLLLVLLVAVETEAFHSAPTLQRATSISSLPGIMKAERKRSLSDVECKLDQRDSTKHKRQSPDTRSDVAVAPAWFESVYQGDT